MVDGWDITELVEEEVIEKIEAEEEEKQVEEQQSMMSWICEFCTLENDAANSICDVCGNAMPIAKNN